MADALFDYIESRRADDNAAFEVSPRPARRLPPTPPAGRRPLTAPSPPSAPRRTGEQCEYTGLVETMGFMGRYARLGGI